MGLRERKNARTKAAIERAALELALEQGFADTTVNQIAERADVSPRSIYVRFGTKDAILIEAPEVVAAQFDHELRTMPGDLVDRLHTLIVGALRGAEAQEDDLTELRTRALLTDPYLRAVAVSQLDAVAQVIAHHITEDLGLSPADVRPRMFAGAATGLVLGIADRALADPEASDPVGTVQRHIDHLRAFYDQLRPE